LADRARERQTQRGGAIVLRSWRVSLAIVALLATGVTIGPSVAQKSTPDNSASLSSREKRVAAGEAYAKQLLLLMDTDKSGKVSKKEFMDFMSAEFDHLDTSKDGQLDVAELTRLQPRPYLGK
jgi:EF hand